MKRVLDPGMRSNSLQALDGRFVGAEAIVAKAKETGKFDYDAPMEGLQAIDRYTLQLKLNFADYELLSNLTTVATAGIAREVVEAYADGTGWVMANPVGTGPYRLKDWRRGQRIVLEANPTFRDEFYPGEPSPRRSRVREAPRQEAAADGSHRDQHHRGIESAAARLRAGRSRLRGGAARSRFRTCSSRATS